MFKMISSGLILAAGLTSGARAEPTPMVIRVIAKDAKFVGTEMGGVAITLSDADTGQVLASGQVEGGTGNTAQIMKDSHARRDLLANDKAAKYTTSLDLEQPRRITVTAVGPKLPANAANSVSATQWVLPGKGVAGGDGWVLEMPGFVIDPLDTPNEIHLTDGKFIPLHVKVTMMCGCPITPGGQWDANKFEILATVKHAGKPPITLPLAYGGTASEFTAQLPTNGTGEYQVTVTAFDPADGNTGLARIAVAVR